MAPFHVWVLVTCIAFSRIVSQPSCLYVLNCPPSHRPLLLSSKLPPQPPLPYSLTRRLVSGALAPEDRTLSPPPPNLRGGNVINSHSRAGQRHKNKTSRGRAWQITSQWGRGELFPVWRVRMSESLKCTSIEDACCCSERPSPTWLLKPKSKFCNQMRWFALDFACTFQNQELKLKQHGNADVLFKNVLSWEQRLVLLFTKIFKRKWELLCLQTPDRQEAQRATCYQHTPHG